MGEMQREFQGIWIPKEIWLDPNLNALDKIIFAEITSFSSTEKGCYASNEYFAKFCQCSESKISKTISKLIDMGYVELLKFDGRTRVLKSCLVKFTMQKINYYQAEQEKMPAINTNISSCISTDISISPYNPPKGDEPKPKKKSQKDFINYDEVLEKFKAICISLPKPLQLSDSRKRAIKKIEPLITKFGGWEKFFEKIQSSSFLTGNKTQWKAEFDWVLKEKNAIKIIEGSYDDAKQVNNQQQETKPNLADSQQRDDTVATFLGLNSLDELEDYKQEE